MIDYFTTRHFKRADTTMLGEAEEAAAEPAVPAVRVVGTDDNPGHATPSPGPLPRVARRNRFVGGESRWLSVIIKTQKQIKK